MPSALIVGAGFSRAISSVMPLVPDLTDLVQLELTTREIPVDDVPPFSDNFERWLTYLSQDLPWLGEARRLRNRALFADISVSLARVLLDAQNEVAGQPCPAWLTALLRWCHEDRTTIISFNYDMLVEKAAAFATSSAFYAVPTTPIASRRGAVLASEPIETFRLLKLHGSINWYYSGSPHFAGETIYEVPLGRAWDMADTEEEIGESVIDKVPLIVPPTLSKSSYFDNETVRAQWIIARQALTQAGPIGVLGYSMPESDDLVRFMLQEAIPRRRVTIVNPDAAVAARFRDLLGAEPISVDSIPTFAETVVDGAWTE